MSTLIVVEDLVGGDPTWVLANNADDLRVSDEPNPAWCQKATRHVYITSGQNVDHSVVSSVTRSDRETRSAALFSLEDNLAETPEKLHIALGSRVDASSDVWVATCSRSFIKDVLDVTEAMRLDDPEIISDVSLFLDRPSDTIISRDDRLFLLNGKKAVSVEPSLAADLLPALCTELNLEAPVIDGELPVRIPNINTQQAESADGPVQLSLIDLIARQVLAGQGINLRQAEYASKSTRRLPMEKLRLGLFLIVLALLAWTTLLLVETRNLEAGADRQFRDAQQAYLSAFPDEGAAADPRTQIARRLTTFDASGPTFNEMTALLYSALASVEGVELLSVNYDGADQQISASLAFASYESREALKSAVEDRGATLTLGASRQTETAIVGDIVVGVPR